MYCGFHKIPWKLWYSMYLYPLWVRFQQVQVQLRKIVPTVYLWQTLSEGGCYKQPQVSTNNHGPKKMSGWVIWTSMGQYKQAQANINKHRPEWMSVGQHEQTRASARGKVGGWTQTGDPAGSRAGERGSVRKGRLANANQEAVRGRAGEHKPGRQWEGGWSHKWKGRGGLGWVVSAFGQHPTIFFSFHSFWLLFYIILLITLK